MAVLRTWRNRNWFTDPAGWAHDALSSRAGYASFQILCICGGVLCCAAIWIPASRLGVGLGQTWGLYLLALVFSTILPSIYLRAARRLVLRESRPHEPRESAV
jgi:hypothetical protein